jgi:hypothetical protein
VPAAASAAVTFDAAADDVFTAAEAGEEETADEDVVEEGELSIEVTVEPEELE